MKSRLPKISCMCVTYGRREVLDECVHSFLIQDYPGEKELIILNDYADIKLVGEFPDVQIVNKEKRYNSLGEKRNACIEMCSGEIICIWDDDDIFLPNRLSSAVKRIGIKPYMLLNKHIYYSDEVRIIPYGVKAQAYFYKALWQEVGGYPHINNGEDMKFENKIRSMGKFSITNIPEEEIAYIYRWRTTNNYHISSFHAEGSYDGPEQFVKEHVEKGVYEIKPSWKKDYTQVLKNLLKEGSPE